MDKRKTNYIVGMELEDVIYEKIIKNEIYYNLNDVLCCFTKPPFHIKKYGDRNYNFDFIINDEKVEIKNNCDSIFKLPEILQLSCSSINDDTYIEYFYYNYLPKITDTEYSYDMYIKNVNNFSKRDTFFKSLYSNRNKFNDIVNESIETYLEQANLKEISKYILTKITQQFQKHFILYKNECFYYDKIKPFRSVHISHDKNCILMNTGRYLFKCLLRWKNGNGVNLPAYQISIHKNELKIPVSIRKKDGIYFTPKSLVQKIINRLCELKVNINNVLEPSCGCGVFLDEIIKYTNKYEAYELNEDIYKYISRVYKVKNIDYLSTDIETKFDLIIGNPPYYIYNDKRYSNYFTGRTNIFIQFIIHSLLKLNENGVLCFVIPSTFMNCQYYYKTREFIKNNFMILDIFKNKESFEYTDYKTITIIIQNKKGDNDKYVYNDIFTINKNKLEAMMLNNHFKLNELDNINIFIGKFIWNENKNKLVDDDTKPILIYKPKSSRISYVNVDDTDTVYNKNLLIINRGYGQSKYNFNYEYINSSDYENGFLIENHNIVIATTEDNYKLILESFKNPLTIKFINKYTTNGAMNINDLLNNIVMFY